MKTFKDHIEEGKLSCEERFEKYVFGVFGNEWDTKSEHRIAKEVNAFLYFNKANPKIVKAFEELKACRSKYPKELDPKNGKIVWRGISKKNNEVKQIKFTKEYKGFYVADNFTYTPHREIQSFTTNWKTAEEFSLDGDWKKASLIIESYVDDDFIFTSKFTNMFSILREYEVVRISNKPLKNCRVYISKTDWKDLFE